MKVSILSKMCGLFVLILSLLCLIACSGEHEHKWSDWKTLTEVTCTENGLQERTCKCGESEIQQIAALGHTEVVDEGSEPNCTEDGLSDGAHCDVCKEIIVPQRRQGATGHNSITLEAVEATCTDMGLTEGAKCSECGDVITAQLEIPALGHTVVVDQAFAATCTTVGKTEGSHCSECDHVLVAQQPIAAKGHKEVNVLAVAATCTSTGLTEGKKCTVCGTFTDPQANIPAIGHMWSDWLVNSENKTARLCETCHESQHITHLNAKYGGGFLLIGESVDNSDVSVTATISDGTKMEISGFVLKNALARENGDNLVTVSFLSVNTTVPVPAIYDNLPNTNPADDFGYFEGKDSIIIHSYRGDDTTVVIPAQINRLPVTTVEDIFRNKSEIVSVTIPDSVTSEIDDYTFSGCKKLKSVIIGDSVPSIGYLAFSMCLALEEVYIGKSVKSISGNAFPQNAGKESGIVTLNYAGSEADWSTIKIERAFFPYVNTIINYNYKK